jgi:hypothetical protein
MTIDPKGVKIWKLGDKNTPEYDEENYEVAKFAMFQVIFNVISACCYITCQPI